MTKKEIAFLISGCFFTFLIILGIVLMIFGITPFIFGKPFIDFFGAVVILSVTSFCILVFAMLNARKDEFSHKAAVAIKTIMVVFAVLLSLIACVISLFLCEKTISKFVADDKRHEVLVETDALSGGWNVILYKRYSPFFKNEMKSFYINDMASDDTTVSVEWYDDGCGVSYDALPDYGDSSESYVFTQRIYYVDKTDSAVVK